MSGLRNIDQILLLLIIVEVYNLRYVFPNLIISASSKSEAVIFMTLALLLFQTLIFFLFSLNLFTKSFAASGR